jgi:hypothetical protein
MTAELVAFFTPDFNLAQRCFCALEICSGASSDEFLKVKFAEGPNALAASFIPFNPRANHQAVFRASIVRV